MKPTKIVAGLAIAGGLAAGAFGISTGVANAAPGPGASPVPVDWRPGPPGPWQGGPGWGGPGPVGWGAPPPAPWQGGPIPGGWNGGWEPPGGVCLFNLCV
jgi:hypothetical protein